MANKAFGVSIINVTGDLDVGGQTELDNLNISGISTFGGSLDINNGVDISGDVFIADRLGHSGDQNNCIRFPANDTFTVETAGQERIRVNSSGRLGIGTDNPTNMLDIAGSSPTIELNDTDTGVIHRVNANSGAGIWYFDNDINNVGSDGSFVFRHGHLNGGGTVFSISSIGTLTLGANSGTIRRSGDTNTYINFTGSDAIRFFTGNSERLEINNGGFDVTGHTELDNVNISGVVTATSFVGPVTGDVTGNADTATTATNLSDAANITTGTLADARIPNLAASKITSGTFDSGRIPNLAASKITSGTLNVDITTSRVTDEIATSTAGTKGSYAFLGQTTNTARNPNATLAGSSLLYANANGPESTSPSGSWRLMGKLGTGDDQEKASVWVRYA